VRFRPRGSVSQGRAAAGEAGEAVDCGGGEETRRIAVTLAPCRRRVSGAGSIGAATANIAQHW